MLLETISKVNKEDYIVYIVYYDEDMVDLYYGNPYRPFNSMDIREIAAKDFEPLRITNSVLLIAAVDTERRRETHKFFSDNFEINSYQYGFIYHPSTVVASTASIGNCCYFGPNVSIAPFAKIGSFAYINRNASVGHHTQIGEFCTLNPGCNIGGNTMIGNNVTIGMGASVFDNIVIGENVTIGAGSVVTKNVPSNTIVYGVPAKPIREKKEEHPN